MGWRATAPLSSIVGEEAGSPAQADWPAADALGRVGRSHAEWRASVDTVGGCCAMECCPAEAGVISGIDVCTATAEKNADYLCLLVPRSRL